MILYRIRDWDKHYENNRTRAMDEMRWLPIPNKHDGDGYTALVDGPDGAALLGCWLAVTQVASKCHPRGTLLRDNKIPHTAGSIARITRLPEALLQKCLEKASSPEIGWLEIVEVTDPQEEAFERHPNVTRTSTACVQSTIEGNGIEGNGIEGNGIEGNGEAAPFPLELIPDDQIKSPPPKPAQELRSRAVSILTCLNETAGRKYEACEETLKPIIRRLKEGHPVEELQKMVRREVALDPTSKWHQPSTLFVKNFQGAYAMRDAPIENKTNYFQKPEKKEITDERHAAGF